MDTTQVASAGRAAAQGWAHSSDLGDAACCSCHVALSSLADPSLAELALLSCLQNGGGGRAGLQRPEQQPGQWQQW